MTKLEFLDKINDILIGLNTAESDALGSLYDELMRDNNWSQVRTQTNHRRSKDFFIIFLKLINAT